MTTVLVRGIGDVGSAVAHRLFQAGYAVMIHDVPKPNATRRGMAFTDAVFDGRAALAGVEAVRLDDVREIMAALAAHVRVPVTVGDFSALVVS